MNKFPLSLLFFTFLTTLIKTENYECRIKVFDFKKDVYVGIKCDSQKSSYYNLDLEIYLNKSNRKKKDCDAGYTTIKYKKMEQLMAERYTNMKDISFDTDYRITCEWEAKCILNCKDVEIPESLTDDSFLV